MAAGPVGQQLVAHRVHQVGLAQADAAVDEQRVVKMAGRARDMHGRGARHAVGRALDQGVESQRRVEPVLEGGGGAVLADLGRLGAPHSVSAVRRTGVSPGGGFPRSKR